MQDAAANPVAIANAPGRRRRSSSSSRTENTHEKKGSPTFFNLYLHILCLLLSLALIVELNGMLWMPSLARSFHLLATQQLPRRSGRKGTTILHLVDLPPKRERERRKIKKEKKKDNEKHYHHRRSNALLMSARVTA